MSLMRAAVVVTSKSMLIFVVDEQANWLGDNAVSVCIGERSLDHIPAADKRRRRGFTLVNVAPLALVQARVPIRVDEIIGALAAIEPFGAKEVVRRRILSG